MKHTIDSNLDMSRIIDALPHSIRMNVVNQLHDIKRKHFNVVFVSHASSLCERLSAELFEKNGKHLIKHCSYVEPDILSSADVIICVSDFSATDYSKDAELFGKFSLYGLGKLIEKCVFVMAGVTPYFPDEGVVENKQREIRDAVKCFSSPIPVHFDKEYNLQKVTDRIIRKIADEATPRAISSMQEKYVESATVRKAKSKYIDEVRRIVRNEAKDLPEAERKAVNAALIENSNTGRVVKLGIGLLGSLFGK